MDFAFFAPWDQVLPREAGHVVAVAGDDRRLALLDAAAGALQADGTAVVRLGVGAPDPGDDQVLLADAGPGVDAEPAWPVRTSLAVLAVAIDGVGGRIDASLAPARRPAGIDPWEPLTWDHLEALVAADLAGVPTEVPVLLALVGLEDQPDSIGLFEFTGRLMARPRLPLVLFVALGEDGPAIRACCRRASDD